MTNPISKTAPKVALITGITGQDGSYLAEFLLEKGYIVHGIKRRASSFNTARVDHIYQDPHVDNARFKLHYGDLSDSSNLTRIIQQTQPDDIYNLGAQSRVAVDIRKGSPTFGKCVGAELSDDNRRQMWGAPGFAHGFLVTSESADFLYKTTDYCAPQHERRILWNDPAIDVQWPLGGMGPQISVKDSMGGSFADVEVLRT